MNIYFNNKNTRNFGIDGLEIETTKIYDSCVVNRKIETEEVDGHDGYYTIDKGLEDRKMTLEFNIKDRNNIRNSVREINRWLLNIEDDRLQFEDDKDVYYKVKKLTISNFTYEVVDFIAVFTVELVLDPYLTLNDNESIFIINSGTIVNNYSLSKPIYKLEGEGYINLTINSKTVKINVGQNLTIDTDFQECYRDGLQQVNVLEGDYEDMWLQEGINTISYTNGTVTKFEIIPNWRTK